MLEAAHTEYAPCLLRQALESLVDNTLDIIGKELVDSKILE